MTYPLVIAPEIEAALRDRAPVVALESTVIAHGLPSPDNLAVAGAMQAAVRRAGAVPAVIGVEGGAVRVGLDEAAILRLASADGVLKISRRDLAYAVALRIAGATTVSATMICARLAGIAVMATGGIGGVHRGAETTLDVSADLEELARTEIAVVCAGAKAILDLPRTLEYLETKGVPVIGYRTDFFPAFFVRSSGLPVVGRVDAPEAAARLIAAQRSLGLGGGILIANPAPERAALDPAIAEAAISAAVAAAADAGIRGKALTPFLLDYVGRATGGDSIVANRALLEANAELAARIAVALAAESRTAATPACGAIR